MKHKFQTLELTKMALFAALVCVSATLSFLCPFLP